MGDKFNDPTRWLSNGIAPRNLNYQSNVVLLIFLIEDHGHPVLVIKGYSQIVVVIDDISQ